MKPVTLLLIYLAFFLADFFTDWVLDILNINEVLKNRKKVPAFFRDWIDRKTYRRSTKYTLRRSRFGLIRSVYGRLLVVLVFVTGAPALLYNLLASLGWPVYWQGVVYLAAVSAVLSLASLPFSFYSQFVIEEEFGFNTSTVRTLISDAVKQAVMGLVLLMILLAGLYAALAWTGFWWWAAAWGFMSLFQLILVILYPLWIAPLFNKFEPLPDGALKQRLAALAERTGFQNQGIYVMDGSRRSRHSNAYFTGLGRFRRIVIYDTLMDSLEDDELEAVLAHEIGHWKHGHIRKSLIISLALSLAGFALAGRLLEWPVFFTAFRLGAPSLHGLLFWMTFFASPLTAFLTPLQNRRSRRHEYQADRFAVEACGNADAMKRALLNLSRENLSNLTPHPVYSAWHYSHPALGERIAAFSSEQPQEEHR